MSILSTHHILNLSCHHSTCLEHVIRALSKSALPQILGTGINSAGSAAPVNAPVAEAQRDAMRRAWDQTGRQPSEVYFVELHATGAVWETFSFNYLSLWLCLMLMLHRYCCRRSH